MRIFEQSGVTPALDFLQNREKVKEDEVILEESAQEIVFLKMEEKVQEDDVSDNDMIHDDGNDDGEEMDIKIEVEIEATREELKNKASDDGDECGDMDEQLLFTCDQCQFNTQELDALQEHMQSVHTVGSHPCQLCAYVSLSAHALTLHNEQKHGSLPSGRDNMPILESGTTQQLGDNSQENSRTDRNKQLGSGHSSGRQYQCKFCPHKANNKLNLTVHVTTKHAEKTFACDQCAYKGVTFSKLRKHVRSAHEASKYQCPLCAFKGTTKKMVRDHVETVHEQETEHRCDRCPFVATERASLKGGNILSPSLSKTGLKLFF